MSGYALPELAGEKDRRRVVENLWNRTTGFMVLIEEGTKAGHAALLEARDWLVFIFIRSIPSLPYILGLCKRRCHLSVCIGA